MADRISLIWGTRSRFSSVIIEWFLEPKKFENHALIYNEWLIGPGKPEEYGHILSKILGQENLNIYEVSGQENPNTILLLDKYKARKTWEPESLWSKISGQENLNIYLSVMPGQENPSIKDCSGQKNSKSKSLFDWGPGKPKVAHGDTEKNL